ncbi:hypothetical protein C2R22_14710 [Salinigranum rubrum]|uniref:Sulfatase N-terminal domain-containing protein n=1 Tax=Salinigranum rubrum TaxID=755307 RepID=A0A2I8VNP9_9EURY|nr:hypothetical protein C2R22_14710 [Salinigranum rubrum]
MPRVSPGVTRDGAATRCTPRSRCGVRPMHVGRPNTPTPSHGFEAVPHEATAADDVGTVERRRRSNCRLTKSRSPLGSRRMDDRRNIVLVTADSLRADHCGHLDGENLTPNLDRLAADGVAFETAMANAGATRASMSSFLTGRYPHARPTASSVRDLVGQHFAAEDTLPERLSRRGYETAVFTANPWTSRYFLDEDLFDHFVDFIDGDGDTPSETSGDVGTTVERGGTLNRMVNWWQGQDMFMTWEAMSDRIETWLADASEPYFCWVFVVDPHMPYLPPRPTARSRNCLSTPRTPGCTPTVPAPSTRSSATCSPKRIAAPFATPTSSSVTSRTDSPRTPCSGSTPTTGRCSARAACTVTGTPTRRRSASRWSSQTPGATGSPSPSRSVRCRTCWSTRRLRRSSTRATTPNRTSRRDSPAPSGSFAAPTGSTFAGPTASRRTAFGGNAGRGGPRRPAGDLLGARRRVGPLDRTPSRGHGGRGRPRRERAVVAVRGDSFGRSLFPPPPTDRVRLSGPTRVRLSGPTRVRLSGPTRVDSNRVSGTPRSPTRCGLAPNPVGPLRDRLTRDDVP